jgi:hypothetical protein
MWLHSEINGRVSARRVRKRADVALGAECHECSAATRRAASGKSNPQADSFRETIFADSIAERAESMLPPWLLAPRQLCTPHPGPRPAGSAKSDKVATLSEAIARTRHARIRWPTRPRLLTELPKSRSSPGPFSGDDPSRHIRVQAPFARWSSLRIRKAASGQSTRGRSSGSLSRPVCFGFGVL